MKICIIGDLMVDMTVYGTCSRLSPEAPIPVLQRGEEVLQPGGAGNAAKNLKALMPKSQIILAGFLSDGYKDIFCDFDLSWCEWVPEMNTKLRYIDQRTGYQLVRVDNEKSIGIIGSFISPGKALKMIVVEEPDFIILSDYGKGAITGALARDVICAARAERTPVLVDTRKATIDCFKEANYITPNRHEFCRITGTPENSPLINKVAQLTLEDMELDGILLTRGEQGMDLHLKDGVFHEEADKKAVIDVTGAGDTALAAFALAIQSMEPQKALWIANKAAGDVCLKKGTAVPDLTLEDYEKQYEKNRAEKK